MSKIELATERQRRIANTHVPHHSRRSEERERERGGELQFTIE